MAAPTSDLIAELRWRNMVQDIVPETEAYLAGDGASGYIGFDPTAASLHVGSLLPIVLLRHLQRAGVRPIALVGGATGMVGDPSGKSAERNLLDRATLEANVAGIEAQLRRLLDFDHPTAPAILRNNLDWMGELSFLDFIRDVGKHVTVGYMMTKDSVRNRLETGLSFTEFSYQLIQGYDFLHLYRAEGCGLQCGGSDQWGNITTGIELIRRMDGGSAYAFTCPLLTRADGSKFGKSASGENIWLDPERTSPYAFYQFWIGQADADAGELLRKFTFLERGEIEALEKSHADQPHRRILQSALAREVTTWVHGDAACERAIAVSQILFGRSTRDDLERLGPRDLEEIFSGVPRFEVERSALEAGIDILDFLTGATDILPSKGEGRRALKENSIQVNKDRVASGFTVDASCLLADRHIVVQRGKKKYFLVTVTA